MFLMRVHGGGKRSKPRTLSMLGAIICIYFPVKIVWVFALEWNIFLEVHKIECGTPIFCFYEGSKIVSEKFWGVCPVCRDVPLTTSMTQVWHSWSSYVQNMSDCVWTHTNADLRLIYSLRIRHIDLLLSKMFDFDVWVLTSSVNTGCGKYPLAKLR